MQQYAGFVHGHSRQPTFVRPAPPGTFTPGTKVQVGRHRALIERYLNEGGFAHVYTVTIPTQQLQDKQDQLLQDGQQSNVAVLKRVAVPDKDALAGMRIEVETMKKLKGHRHIVTYIDSHASPLKTGGFEVFLLMEFCPGGGLIDFMNTRLHVRLTEPEILKIFSDISQGVACMHYLRPPLLHRDLKVENVLISGSADYPTYKICDFGSTALPRPAATTAAEGRLIEEDVQRHTTFQYRSPEMIDVYSRLPINEKSDIWALGVLLYKLCYYTTPFEGAGHGPTAILNGKVGFPAAPPYSNRMKMLILAMLQTRPDKRPNIYEVVKEVCALRSRQIPIPNIYQSPFHPLSTDTIDRSEKSAQSPSSVQSPDVLSIGESCEPVRVGLQAAKPRQDRSADPEVAEPRSARPSEIQSSGPPMRRGRPPRPGPASAHGAGMAVGPNQQTVSGDPFAALDALGIPASSGRTSPSHSPKKSERAPSQKAVSNTGPPVPEKLAGVSRKTSSIKPPSPSVQADELSAKFPSLDEFDIMYSRGAVFDPAVSDEPHELTDSNVVERPPIEKKPAGLDSDLPPPVRPTSVFIPSQVESRTSTPKAASKPVSKPPIQMAGRAPMRVSVGTNTSPVLSPRPSPRSPVKISLFRAQSQPGQRPKVGPKPGGGIDRSTEPADQAGLGVTGARQLYESNGRSERSVSARQSTPSRPTKPDYLDMLDVSTSTEKLLVHDRPAGRTIVRSASAYLTPISHSQSEMTHPRLVAIESVPEHQSQSQSDSKPPLDWRSDWRRTIPMAKPTERATTTATTTTTSSAEPPGSSSTNTVMVQDIPVSPPQPAVKPVSQPTRLRSEPRSNPPPGPMVDPTPGEVVDPITKPVSVSASASAQASSAIQQRLNMFLSEANKSVTPPRTAAGYGRFTAPEPESGPVEPDDGAVTGVSRLLPQSTSARPAVGPKPVGLRGK